MMKLQVLILLAWLALLSAQPGDCENSTEPEQVVPPNHSCSISMVAYKYKADIPYTAHLSRTYSNGETTWTSISGTYNSVQIREVQAVVDRCEPIPDAHPCAQKES
ncbi:natterin-3-like isoform X1 [Lates japonicus]|uniref:Natterin-3-like isoform X1 n=1 Tax=Lates japonicus TaxID=270547 RepID=A0AAD3RP81_LATJO|nr:natterin-3-like isoform X1 [Lates japonicus]